MDAIVEMLDRLADYQAQADILEIDKRKLLDEVKIPAEVLALQDQANKARQSIDSQLTRAYKSRQQDKDALMDQIKDPEMPAEFVKALAEVRAKREKLHAEFATLAENGERAAQEAKAKIDAELQVQTREVYAQVAQRKIDIAAEFDSKAESVIDNIAKLTTEIKSSVAQFGKTVKGLAYQAVFVKGRVTWNTDMLDGMIVAFPELGKARKEGNPSVTLRKN